MSNGTSKPNGTFDVAKRVGQLRQIEAKIKEIKEKHEQELQQWEEAREKFRGTLLQWLRSTNQQNAKTDNGTIYQSRRITYRVEDQAEFRHHVIGTQSWGLVYWAKAISAGVQEAMLDSVKALGYRTLEDWQAAERTRLNLAPDADTPLPAPPPGVHVDQEVVLGVRAPTKPRTVGVKTPVDPKDIHVVSTDDQAKNEAL